MREVLSIDFYAKGTRDHEAVFPLSDSEISEEDSDSIGCDYDSEDTAPDINSEPEQFQNEPPQEELIPANDKQ